MSKINPTAEETLGVVASTTEPMYGVDKPKLVSEIEVEGGDGGGGGAKTIIFDRSSAVGTGVQTFNGFGFTPSNYSITTGSGLGSVSWGAYDGIVSKCTYLLNYIGFADISISNTKSIFVQSSATSRTQGEHSNFTSDGIEIRFTESDVTATLIITCFK